MTGIFSAKASAHANIAVAKYWGKRDENLNLPWFDSVSFGVGCLETHTEALWIESSESDELWIDGVRSPDLGHIKKIVSRVRAEKNWDKSCIVRSENTFPSSSGLASSASGCAAAARAVSLAAGLEYSDRELSRLARLGSGSAARSIPSGWVRWYAGTSSDGSDSYASQIADADYWPLKIFVALVSQSPKPVSSRLAMKISQESPFWTAYKEQSSRDADLVQMALEKRDFSALSEVMLRSALNLHALTLTCRPPICYFEPKSIELLRMILDAARKIPVCCTLDAGANVVIVCEETASDWVGGQLETLKIPYISTEIV